MEAFKILLKHLQGAARKYFLNTCKGDQGRWGGGVGAVTAVGAVGAVGVVGAVGAVRVEGVWAHWKPLNATKHLQGRPGWGGGVEAGGDEGGGGWGQ